MCKRFVGFRHFVHVFLLFEGSALTVVGVHKLARKPQVHLFFASLSGVKHQKAVGNAGGAIQAPENMVELQAG